MIVDKKIHFIWVGEIIPVKYATEILNHLDHNYKGYDIYFWTDKPRLSALRFKSFMMSRRAMGFNKEFRDAAWRPIKVEKSKTDPTHSVFSLAYQNTFPSTQPAKRLIPSNQFFHVKGINKLLSNPEWRTRYNASMSEKNYGRASDILRLLILKEEGGIYMDIDVIAKKPLPRNIDAHHGFLMGKGQATHENALTNAVMAAPKDSRCLNEIIESMSNQFAFYEDRSWFRINKSYIKKTREALETTTNRLKNEKDQLQEATKKYASDMSKYRFPNFRKKMGLSLPARPNRKNLKDAETDYVLLRQKLSTALNAGTLVVSGPAHIKLFLYRKILGQQAIDPLTWITQRAQTQPTVNRLQFYYGMKSFISTVAIPELQRSAHLKDYIFPMDSIYIGSDNTWLS